MRGTGAAEMVRGGMNEENSMNRSEQMRALADRINRQRVCTEPEEEKISVRPYEVDMIVQALMLASTLKLLLGEASREAGTGKWPARDGELGLGG